MKNIAENLKKILAAIYGRDVRQAIHDSLADCYDNVIECKQYTDDHVASVEAKMSGITGQCEALVAKSGKDAAKIQEIFSATKTVTVTNGKLWEIQSDNNICSLVEGVSTQYASMDVTPGEWYIVHTCMVSRSSSGRGVYPIIFANRSMGMISTVRIEEEGECDYIVTVPENATCMLVSANETGEGIRIRKINVLREGDTDIPVLLSEAMVEASADVWTYSYAISELEEYDEIRVFINVNNKPTEMVIMTRDVPGIAKSVYFSEEIHGRISIVWDVNNAKIGIMAALGEDWDSNALNVYISRIEGVRKIR